MTKGEIAHHEQFRLLSQCFQKSSAALMYQNASESGKGISKFQKSRLHKSCSPGCIHLSIQKGPEIMYLQKGRGLKKLKITKTEAVCNRNLNLN